MVSNILIGRNIPEQSTQLLSNIRQRPILRLCAIVTSNVGLEGIETSSVWVILENCSFWHDLDLCIMQLLLRV